jgi:4-hydroxy-3-polyprenylbenzoate decarboxylase
LWGLDFLATTKFVIVVDEQVDVHDPAAVWAAVGANVDPGRDVFAHQGPGHATDHAAPQPGLGQQLGFDATAKLGAEHPQPWPNRLAANPQIQQLVDDQWAKYGLTGGK